jgi:GNAT superfamily N-acetyltransferase
MADLLVNLLKLGDVGPVLEELRIAGVVIRRAQVFEITPVRAFIDAKFSTAWADEVSVGFSARPVTVLIATRNRDVIGFAAYECTRKAFFGPMGVVESERGTGIGKGLLLAALQGLKELGYVYGIIGAAGPVEFYNGIVDAFEIPDSEPGIYTDILQPSVGNE